LRDRGRDPRHADRPCPGRHQRGAAPSLGDRRRARLEDPRPRPGAAPRGATMTVMTGILRIRHFIGGEFVDSASGATFDSINPATNEPFASVAAAGPEDVERAVRAARLAFDEGPWPRMSPTERRRILDRIADGIEGRREELARLESTDMGKPI